MAATEPRYQTDTRLDIDLDKLNVLKRYILTSDEDSDNSDGDVEVDLADSEYSTSDLLGIDCIEDDFAESSNTPQMAGSSGLNNSAFAKTLESKESSVTGCSAGAIPSNNIELLNNISINDEGEETSKSDNESRMCSPTLSFLDEMILGDTDSEIEVGVDEKPAHNVHVSKITLNKALEDHNYSASWVDGWGSGPKYDASLSLVETYLEQSEVPSEEIKDESQMNIEKKVLKENFKIRNDSKEKSKKQSVISVEDVKKVDKKRVKNSNAKNENLKRCDYLSKRIATRTSTGISLRPPKCSYYINIEDEPDVSDNFAPDEKPVKRGRPSRSRKPVKRQKRKRRSSSTDEDTEKAQIHNQLERRRREEMRELFRGLYEAVFDVAERATRNHQQQNNSKVSILTNARSLIDRLECESQQLVIQEVKLTMERGRLVRKLKQLKEEFFEIRVKEKNDKMKCNKEENDKKQCNKPAKKNVKNRKRT